MKQVKNPSHATNWEETADNFCSDWDIGQKAVSWHFKKPTSSRACYCLAFLLPSKSPKLCPSLIVFILWLISYELFVLVDKLT